MLHRAISLSLLAFGFAATAAAGPLDKARVGDQVTIPGFAYSGAKRITSDVTLKRIDIYAPGAKIYEVRADGTFEVPRSDKLMFVSDPSVTASRLFVVYDAKRGTFTGGVSDSSGLYLIDGVVESTGKLRVTRSESPYERDTAFACGTTPSNVDPLHPAGLKPDAVPAAAATKGALRTAVIAIDTDNELLTTRFSNNTSSATTFIAEMFTAMNVFYERDLDVTLQQGTTFLRTTSPDPYPSTTAGSTSDQLNEFAEYWRTEPTLTNGGVAVVPRTFAAMLSGKSSSGNSASGIAWLIDSGNYCTATGQVFGGNQTYGHYSMTRIFTNTGFNGGTSAGIVGHEIGHNFGAMHTHCSSATTGTGPTGTNTIDQCFNGESGQGCYSGTPTCPTDNSIVGRGSVMSYCHFGPSSGAGCGSTLNEFHPAHQTFLRSRVQTNVSNGCMSLAGGTPSANLSVVKTSTTTSALPSAAVSFTITVANAGPDAAASVQLADPTPSGLVFVSASGGGCTTFPCSLGTINNGAQVVVTANYTVSGSAVAGTTITNTATVSSSTTDPTPANNSEGHSITVSSLTRIFGNSFE